MFRTESPGLPLQDSYNMASKEHVGSEKQTIFERKSCCVITGASRGLGRNITLNFASKFTENSVFILLARDVDSLQTVKSECLSKNSKIKVIVRKFDQGYLEESVFDSLFLDIFQENGLSVTDFKQAIIVHNSGTIGDNSKFVRELSNSKTVQSNFDINVTGMILLNTAFLQMFKRDSVKHRIILHMSSLAAIKPFKSWSLYCSGKAARDMFFQVLAAEEPDIRILNYAPGPCQTDMQQQCRDNTADPEVREMFTGMIDAGIGARQVNKVLSAIGIPGVTAKTLKKREQEVQGPLSDIAKKSCNEAILEEINKSRVGDPSDAEHSETTKLSAKYDMCWQKRGSGRSYNSHSGVGSVIGQETGKVLNAKVCCNHCRKCLVAESGGREAEEHCCPRNWTKSAKAMEAHAGAELLQQIEDLFGVEVGTLIMDDDCATLSLVKQNLGHHVEKWSDVNHSKKSLGNAMYNKLQQKHKSLTNDVIKYFQRCFSYAIMQNKNNESGLKSTLLTIVPHAFGKHDNCGTWCKAADSEYSFRSLPGGKCLAGKDLYDDLCVIFETMANNAHKLAPAGSTKDVESLNNMIASKAPKRICFSASSSLYNRVNATISQKNIGYGYVSEVNQAVGLSPGKVTRKHSLSLSRERKRQLQYNRAPAIKKRKYDNVHKENMKLVSQEKTEGITYESNVAMVLDDREKPIIRYRPDLQRIEHGTSINFVMFDLETNSLKEDCEILQIAARHKDDMFSCYIQPTQSISNSSTSVTGLTNVGGVLFLKGNPVRTSSREAAFQNFTLWLGQRKPAVLVGHNAKLFDARRIMHNISKYTCQAEFQNAVSGFVDTLPLFKEACPALENYRQDTVYKNVCGGQYNAHNAVGDVDSLTEIINELQFDDNKLLEFSFTTESLVKQRMFDIETKRYEKTMLPLKECKCLSSNTARKIAESGLQLSDLVHAYQAGKRDAIEKLLGEARVNGLPRVTQNRAVLNKLLTYFN